MNWGSNLDFLNHFCSITRNKIVNIFSLLSYRILSVNIFKCTGFTSGLKQIFRSRKSGAECSKKKSSNKPISKIRLYNDFQAYLLI